MAVRGQRFDINLDSDDEADGVHFSQPGQVPGLNSGLVKDIRERTTSLDAESPAAPKFKSSQTGFPTHKIRTGPSRFKQTRENQLRGSSQIQRNAETNVASPPLSQLVSYNVNGSTSNGQQIDAHSRSKDPSIDQENKQRLAQMSDEEIEEARKELMGGLSPSLIEKLLKKANIEEGGNDTKDELGQSLDEEHSSAAQAFPKRVRFEEPKTGHEPFLKIESANHPLAADPDAPPVHPPPDLQPASQTRLPPPPPPNMHFPQAPKLPDLDPSDPSFLSALHSKYFPSLPSDPSTMAWMTPIDHKVEQESAYSPAQESFTPSSLRFDFRGHLLPPRLSAQISQTKGLHHHAHAPSSAGYTVPELAHLARSAYPAQRCIAYQTLGRVLYRLGRGDFGREGDDLCEGLWSLMDQGRVVEGMVAAAAKGGEGGSQSVWATATEAIW